MAPRRSYAGPALLVGGGLAIGAAVFFALRKSNKTVENVQRATAGDTPPAQPGDPSLDAVQLQPPMQPGTGGYVQLRTTGYWPFTAREDEKKMEGGLEGAAVWRGKRAVDPATGKRVQLVTVEMHRENPMKHPHVSLSGDDAVWPWGQKIVIPWSDGKPIIGRVVDTGQHFRGINKVYRATGWEPLDVCVLSSKSKVPGKVVAQVVPGDNWAGGAAVATAGLKGQTVKLSGDIVEGRTAQDHEALARAVESELGDRSRDEQVAAAWVMRNRADSLAASLSDMLAPNGNFGSPQKSGGYASTRKVPTEKSRAIVSEVLGAESHKDPTGGAVDFWVPEQQSRLNQLGDVYRAAANTGDAAKMKKYQRYANYGSEGDVRLRHAAEGMRVLGIVGVIELLGRKL